VTEVRFYFYMPLTVMLCLGVGIGVLAFWRPAPKTAAVTSDHSFAPPAPHGIKRVNYPFSVIPYGVHAPEDLRRAMAGNAEIAQHFQAFDFRHAKFVVLQRDACAYVSFRRNGKISWTQKCITLHRGELILTDGFYMIRALCGNQVSFTPQAPSEPVDVTLLGPAELPVAPESAPTEVLAENASQPAPAAVGQPIGMPITPPGPPPIVVAGGPPTFPVVIPPHSGGGCCVTAQPHPPKPPQPPAPPTPPGPPVPVPDGGYAPMFVLACVVIAVGIYAKNR
jgi:hypothetical protein